MVGLTWLGAIGIRSSLASKHKTRRGGSLEDAPTLLLQDLLHQALSPTTTLGWRCGTWLRHRCTNRKQSWWSGRRKRRGLKEEGGLSLEKEGHQEHGVLMVWWGPRVLWGCPSLEEVVIQGLPLQSLTLDVYLLFCICVINLKEVVLNMVLLLDEHDACIYAWTWW
jgi:hypothetical protein